MHANAKRIEQRGRQERRGRRRLKGMSSTEKSRQRAVRENSGTAHCDFPSFVLSCLHEVQ